MALTSMPKGPNVAGPIIGAAIGGVASLIGGKKGSDSAKSAAEIQAKLAREALAEQRRVYDIEDKKERERYDYDKNKTVQDEQRVRTSRANAFGGFDANLARFSQGYAPAYGMSGGQTQGLMDARNAGLSGGGGYVAPQMGDKGLGPGPDPLSPQGPQVTPGGPSGPLMGGRGTSMDSTVWLKAPTGETTEVSLADAPMIQKMLQAGATLIPPPTGGL